MKLGAKARDVVTGEYVVFWGKDSIGRSIVRRAGRKKHSHFPPGRIVAVGAYACIRSRVNRWMPR
jgi:hypothetical protein